MQVFPLAGMIKKKLGFSGEKTSATQILIISDVRKAGSLRKNGNS